MGYLTRKQIFAVDDLKKQVVDVPEWGGQVLVRELTTSEVEQIGFEMSDSEGVVDKRNARGVIAQVVTWATIDEEGNRVFTKDDVRALGEKSFKPAKRIAEAVMTMSGLQSDGADLGNG